MAKKSDVTLDDLAIMIQKGFEGERKERTQEIQTFRKEVSDGFKAVRKDMSDGFKQNDRDHGKIRAEAKKNHEELKDDILWIKREIADIRLNIHALLTKQEAAKFEVRLQRIEHHLGLTTV